MNTEAPSLSPQQLGLMVLDQMLDALIVADAQGVNRV